MAAADLYYRLSGKFRITGLLMSLGACALVAAPIGILYGILVHINPIVYLNLLGTIFIGFAVAKVTVATARFGHVRHRGMIILVSLVGGLLVEYFSIMSWILALSEWNLIVISPITMVQILDELSVEGVWSIKDTMVSGYALIAVWVIEAGILIGLPVFNAMSAAGELVYCEQCGKWIDEEQALGPFASIDDEAAMRTDLETGNFAVFSQLKPPTEGSNLFSLLRLRRCFDSVAAATATTCT